jgi:hypothetical protein
MTRRSSQSPKLGYYITPLDLYFCLIDYEKHIMKKLFTLQWPATVCANYVCSCQAHRAVGVNPDFIQIPSSKFTNHSNFTSEINVQLISGIFLGHIATYRKVNPLLLTYSAEITHTYRQTLTTSFTFSRPTDVIPSVLFGSIPNSNTTVSGWK